MRDEDVARILNAVLDGGIDLIDTSIDYGRSEELIGRYLSGRREDRPARPGAGGHVAQPLGRAEGVARARSKSAAADGLLDGTSFPGPGADLGA